MSNYENIYGEIIESNEDDTLINEDQYVITTDGKEEYTSVYSFDDHSNTVINNDQNLIDNEDDIIDEEVKEEIKNDDPRNTHLLIVLNPESMTVFQISCINRMTLENDVMGIGHYFDDEEEFYEINTIDNGAFIVIKKDDEYNVNTIKPGTILEPKIMEKDVSYEFIEDNRTSSKNEVEILRKELEDANKELLANKKELIETQKRLVESEKKALQSLDSVKNAEKMNVDMTMQLLQLQMMINQILKQ
ncbi:hypothetical protein [Staphylococcus phage vB_StaM_SA1]|nr:hypothetical protein [Staphylococcus phage vB_StaM_SA1]